MKTLVPIPPESANDLKRQKQTGPGYQVVSVELKDGRCFDPVVVSEGCVIAVQGYAEVPFQFGEVATVRLNHKRWNFRVSSELQRAKGKSATA
jgi:hypothetical protein